MAIPSREVTVADYTAHHSAGSPNPRMNGMLCTERHEVQPKALKIRPSFLKPLSWAMDGGNGYGSAYTSHTVTRRFCRYRRKAR